MSSLFAFTSPSPFFARTKRKMSGPAGAIALDLDACAGTDSSSSSSNDTKSDVTRTSLGAKQQLLSDATASHSVCFDADVAKTKTPSTTHWLCALGRSIDVREVLGFACWKVLSLLIVVLAVADWIFFFKFVVEPTEPRVRLQYGALWSLFTLALAAFRSAVRAKCGADIRGLADHLEIFIAVSLVMVFSTNIAFYLHAPATAPLRDLGFMLVPEQAVDSPWRPLSDVLTATMPVLGLLQTLVLPRDRRCRVIATFFRVASVAYALRMLTVSLTSLPGPAPHCRVGSSAYAPPLTWIDIVTRVGPMYGQFNSCGDLIFSGHMAYTNSALLLYLRTMDRYCPRFSRLRWATGATFLVTLAALCVAGRKHYTVDVVLGIMISTLVYFHFEHSWVPVCVSGTTAPVLLPVASGMAASRSGYRSKLSYGAKASAYEPVGDADDALFDASHERELLLYRSNGTDSNGSGRAAPVLQHQHQLSAVDFIC